MADFDAFNGDADGICALHQLRLSEPRAAELVTGVKRDIALLKRVHVGPGDRVTALDISLKTNLDAVNRLLADGAVIEYFDHHQADGQPAHPNLHAHIDTSAEVCTSLLVNKHLGGRYLPWAVTAAFGDNLAASARAAAVPLGLSDTALDTLRELGECINYNAYGETTEDLFFHPAELYRLLHDYADPLVFANEAPAFQTLRNGYREDMARAQALQPAQADAIGAVFVLPAEAWARRISGVFGNDLASATPSRAHAVLTQKQAGGYLVSVRSPLANKQGADILCAQFETGGGRKGAAGINHLPESELSRFLTLFDETYSAIMTAKS